MIRLKKASNKVGSIKFNSPMPGEIILLK
jgi:hypothetical protein